MKTQKLILALLFLGLATVASAEWNDPTATPPGNNTAAPVNVSAADQAKSGGLAVGNTTGGLFRALYKVLIGGALNETPSVGEQALKLDVEGAIGATHYCDKDGNNCVAAPLGLGTGAGDNLGNHIATEVLKIGSQAISYSQATAAFHGSGWANSYIRGGINFDPNGAVTIANTGFTSALGLAVIGNNRVTTNPYPFTVNSFAGNSILSVKDNGSSDGELCFNNDCRSAWPSGGTGDSSGVSSITTPNFSGLTTNGSNFQATGAVTLRLRDCATSQVLKWGLGGLPGWQCAEDDTSTNSNSGSGDITAVNAGTGLSGGGLFGAVTLNADTSYLQRRVSDSCTAGSYVSSIAADGTATCRAPRLNCVRTSAGGTGSATAICGGSGSVYVMGGGGNCPGGANIDDSYPTDDVLGWFASCNSASVSMTAYAVCCTL